MSTTPLPLAAMPRATARPPETTPTEDHRAHLSGGARYALGDPTRVPTLRRRGTP